MFAVFTRPDQQGLTDALLYHESGAGFTAALCDAHGGVQPDAACDTAMNALEDGAGFPEDASFCALRLTPNTCAWVNGGNVRLYHFSGGTLVCHSEDCTSAYADYLSGRTAYADIRLHPGYAAREAGRILNGNCAVKPGDALLLCSDGFWQYIYETEMELDLIQARTAQEWLDLMLLRIAQRSRLNGDAISVLAVFVEERSQNEF